VPAAVNHAFEIAFGWQTRNSGDGIITLTERGRGICVVADVLESYMNLRSVDALSDTPRQVHLHASVPQERTVDKESTINWDF